MAKAPGPQPTPTALLEAVRELIGVVRSIPDGIEQIVSGITTQQVQGAAYPEDHPPEDTHRGPRLGDQIALLAHTVGSLQFLGGVVGGPAGETTTRNLGAFGAALATVLIPLQYLRRELGLLAHDVAEARRTRYTPGAIPAQGLSVAAGESELTRAARLLHDPFLPRGQRGELASAIQRARQSVQAVQTAETEHLQASRQFQRNRDEYRFLQRLSRGLTPGQRAAIYPQFRRVRQQLRQSIGRRRGTHAARIAARAATASPVGSMQATASTAARGAAVMAGGAALIRFAGAVGLAIAAIEGAAYAARTFAESVLEGNRRLASYNGAIASAYGQLELHDTFRTLDLAHRTSGTSVELVRAINDLRNATQESNVGFTNLSNRLGTLGAGFNAGFLGDSALGGVSRTLDEIVAQIPPDAIRALGKVLGDTVYTISLVLPALDGIRWLLEKWLGKPAGGAAPGMRPPAEQLFLDMFNNLADNQAMFKRPPGNRPGFGGGLQRANPPAFMPGPGF